MKYDSFSGISIGQIDIFLQCCRELNFSKVADLRYYSPSMVSKTIASIEKALGVQLFEREYHSLKMTEAGKILYAEWTAIYDEFIQAIVRAGYQQPNALKTIQIGMLESTHFCAEYIMFKLENPENRYLREQLQWERRDMHSLVDELNQQKLDIIITWSEETAFLNPEKTDWKNIFMSPDALFIPWDHPLFSKESVTLQECEMYPFIGLSPQVYPHYSRYINEICAQAQVHIHLEHICRSTESARYNLSLGKGLYVAPSLICSDWESDDIRKVELPWPGQTGLIVAWNKTQVTPALRKIIDCITH